MKVSTFGRHKASASLSRISTRSPVVAVAHRTRAMQQQHQSVHQERQHSHHLASTSSPTHGTTPTPHVPDTLPSAVTMFAAHPTSVVITTGIVCVCALRLQGPALGVWDALTVAAVAAFWVLQEWAIHKYLLHAPFQWVGSKIHIDHHQQPYHHVSIDSLTIVVPWMIGAAGVLHVALHGGALSLSATAAYFTMGLCYEWVHFLVHTRYVPRSALGRAVRSNHMKHHLHHEHYWLAFTVPAVDRLLGTAPPPSSVRKSAMARANGGQSRA